MKLKFFLLTCLLIFARGCDFYSTSLWFFDHPEGETNPLTSVFGFGWNALVISNIILIGIIIFLFYYYSFKYVPAKLNLEVNNLKDFVSTLYFNEKGRFYDVLYKTPKNKKVMLAHMGYVLIRVLIIGSFLATIHNLCQYYQVPLYDDFRDIVKRPLFIIYGLILLSAIYYTYNLWKQEYLNNQTN